MGRCYLRSRGIRWKSKHKFVEAYDYMAFKILRISRNCLILALGKVQGQNNNSSFILNFLWYSYAIESGK